MGRLIVTFKHIKISRSFTETVDGLLLKSPHKCRKTYCSILLDGGADNAFVLSQMGHTDISVAENHYHYDRKSDQQKQRLVDNIVDFKPPVNM